MSHVYCFRPNIDFPDDLHLVVDPELDDLREGLEPAGDQCGSCGGCGWVVRRNDAKHWVVRCERDHGLDTPGCGAECPVLTRPEDLVIF